MLCPQGSVRVDCVVDSLLKRDLACGMILDDRAFLNWHIRVALKTIILSFNR